MRGRARLRPPADGPAVLLAAVGVAIAFLLLLLVVFQGIDTFSHRDNTVKVNQTLVVNQTQPAGCVEEIITSNSSIEVVVNDLDSICQPFEITTWRLHRVCDTVHFGFQGFCRDASSGQNTLALDLSMVNFPVAYQTPSPNLQRTDVSGVGSALVEGHNIAAILEVDGDESSEGAIDVDMRFGSDYTEGNTIEIALLCIFEAA